MVPVEIGGGSLVNLAEMGAVSVTGERVAEGNFVRLTLEFEGGQETTLNVPVVAKDEEFSDVKTASTTATTP